MAVPKKFKDKKFKQDELIPLAPPRSERPDGKFAPDAFGRFPAPQGALLEPCPGPGLCIATLRLYNSEVFANASLKRFSGGCESPSGIDLKVRDGGNGCSNKMS